MPMPPAWAELIEALKLLATHASDDISPFQCSHDTLNVMADPEAFSHSELGELEALGFHPSQDGTFYSFRFGSA